MVDTHYIILFGLIAIPLVVAVIGAYLGKRENNSTYTAILLFASAGLWITLFLATDRIIVGYTDPIVIEPILLSTDHITVNATEGNNVTTLRASQVTTSTSFNLGTDGGASGRFVGEKFTATSAMVGQEIDTVEVILFKTGSPSVTIEICEVDTVGACVTTFGTISSASITGSQTAYNFTKTDGDYTIQSGDIIGVRAFYSGAFDTRVHTRYTTSDLYDSTNSHRAHVLGSVVDSTTQDFRFRMFDTDFVEGEAAIDTTIYNHNGDNTYIPSEPIYYDFNDELKYMFLVIAAMTSLIAATTVSTGRSGGFKPFDKL